MWYFTVSIKLWVRRLFRLNFSCWFYFVFFLFCFWFTSNEMQKLPRHAKKPREPEWIALHTHAMRQSTESGYFCLYEIKKDFVTLWRTWLQVCDVECEGRLEVDRWWRTRAYNICASRSRFGLFIFKSTTFIYSPALVGSLATRFCTGITKKKKKNVRKGRHRRGLRLSENFAW